ncbi:MAG: hypothetical protein CMQ34_02845 [Gammaproteobacteria bacterium]|nr:hypothetical protein [Gammaproteobacteria bacterium]|tara:strand:+ start:4526 stop:5569 length:1044 start_codon:yes stop_codon:yes gene_type:complete
MAKQLIILVHGMGTHPKGEMEKAFKQGLTDRAEGFAVDVKEKLKSVDYVEFNYSDFFDAIRNQFAENAQARKTGFSFLTGKGFEVSLLKQLTSFEANMGKDEFFYTHMLDVILYSTTYFGEKIRVDFLSLFEAKRLKYGHKNIHIICHSLGTAVVHDALSKYYRVESDPYDDIPDLKPGNFNIASLWTFANVSRMVNLLNGQSDPMSSTVCTGAEGCARNLINISHKYDPFTWFKQYDRKMKDGVTLESSLIRNVNTHDFYEYITEPKVARALMRFIYGVNVTEDQNALCVEAYKKKTLKGEVKALRDMIKKLRDDPSISEIKKAIAQYKKLQSEIERISAELGGND